MANIAGCSPISFARGSFGAFLCAFGRPIRSLARPARTGTSNRFDRSRSIAPFSNGAAGLARVTVRSVCCSAVPGGADALYASLRAFPQGDFCLVDAAARSCGLSLFAHCVCLFVSFPFLGQHKARIFIPRTVECTHTHTHQLCASCARDGENNNNKITERKSHFIDRADPTSGREGRKVEQKLLLLPPLFITFLFQWARAKAITQFGWEAWKFKTNMKQIPENHCRFFRTVCKVMLRAATNEKRTFNVFAIQYTHTHTESHCGS